MKIRDKEITLFQSLVPIILLVGLLSYNVFIYKTDALLGSNQFALLVGAAIATCVGLYNRISYRKILKRISKNLGSTTGAILILLFVGALSGIWLLSGIIPAMIYYGLKLINPSVFLMATVIVCIIISLSTGSSWTTSATVGLALIGMGNTFGISSSMTAGAVISGAYFGDKMSPLSDTTNLAPAISGTDLFTHIRYMTFTMVPSIILTLIFFGVVGFFIDMPDTAGSVDDVLISIKEIFYITPWLFLVPTLILFLIVKKVRPLVAIFIGTMAGVLFALIFQPNLVIKASGISTDTLSLQAAYKGIFNAITVENSIPSDNYILSKLFQTGGMSGMLGTIWLIICAMTFGGVMSAIGALKKITNVLLSMFNSIFGLFASTVASCLVVNVTASDQYLSILIPGEMFNKAFKKRKLAPENLSRTLEDSATVVSPLVPWNTCGAYQSSVLGVPTLDYLPYAVFNLISPIMTLLFAAMMIKIRRIK